METTSTTYKKWKRATKRLIKRGLRFVCKLTADGELTAYTSEYPEKWTYEQRMAFERVTSKVRGEMASQFERRREEAVGGGSFFASLSKTVDAIKKPDPEMNELNSASARTQPGHWRAATWMGLRYWFCTRCGRTYWWVGSGCGRNVDGVPSVKCYHCHPPRPGQATACGRGEETEEAAAGFTGGNHMLPNVPPAPAGEAWEAVDLRNTERRAWVARAATAPTAEAAWRCTPPDVRAKLRAAGTTYRGSDGKLLQ